MNNKRSMNKIIRYTFLLGIFLLTLGTTYALFSVTLTGNKKNRIRTGNFSLKLTDVNGNVESDGIAINLQEAVPTEDKVGMKSEAYEFVVENDGNIPASYDLVIDGGGSLDPRFIKYSLTQKDYLEKSDGTYYMGGLYKDTVKCYTGLECTYSADNLASLKDGVIHTTTLIPGEKIGYELRFWIDWDATENDVSLKSYESNVIVNGVQATSVMEGNVGDNITYTLYKDGTLVLDGTGPIRTTVDNMTVDHGGPYLDIIAKYLEKNGINKLHTDNISQLNGSLITYLTGNEDLSNIYSSSNTYLFCQRGYDDDWNECFSQSRELMENIPYYISRVVLNEGITSLKNARRIFTLTGDYMLTIPSTLEELEDYDNDSLNFESYEGYTLIFPPRVTTLGTMDSSSLDFHFYFGGYLEYIDYSNINTIGSQSLFLNAIDGVVNIGDNVERIRPFGVYVSSYANTLNIPNSVNIIDAEGVYISSSIKVNVDNTRQFVVNNWNSMWLIGKNPSSIEYLRQ